MGRKGLGNFPVGDLSPFLNSVTRWFMLPDTELAIKPDTISRFRRRVS